MIKELYIAAHEELIEEMLEANPNMSEAEAYDKTADASYNRMTDKIADQIDYLRAVRKEG